MINAGTSHRELAEPHRPSTPEGLASAAREPLRNGLTDHDIAHILRMDVAQIRQILGGFDPGAA
jgi:hypothetical protein